MDKDIPYIVYESEAARHERIVKRLLLIILISFILLIASNLAWLFVFNQYNFTSESYTIESNDDGISNYLNSGTEGVINNGVEDTSKEEDSN